LQALYGQIKQFVSSSASSSSASSSASSTSSSASSSVCVFVDDVSYLLGAQHRVSDVVHFVSYLQQLGTSLKVRAAWCGVNRERGRKEIEGGSEKKRKGTERSGKGERGISLLKARLRCRSFFVGREVWVGSPCTW
jgi:hypothetical protein